MENSVGGSDVEAGFAKLQGVDFEYYMQTYSIILGRNSKNFIVDLDLTSLGGGKKISRQHARIFFDFTSRRFALEVFGKNGCFIQGVLYLPGNPVVKLNSQDLIQIGDLQFYFLLPVRNILSGPNRLRHYPNNVVASASASKSEAPIAAPSECNLATTTTIIARSGTPMKNRKRVHYEDQYNDDDCDGRSSKKKEDQRDGYKAHSKGKALMAAASS
ncbi:hypothetical protein Lal_00037911 [Lupinus albus]|nr:hypothetical protein Lal_00037911 [Lupinus albus]